MNDIKRPKHCKDCLLWHCAGHKRGSRLERSKYQNWCCEFGQFAPKVVTQCIRQGKKRIGSDGQSQKKS